MDSREEIVKRNVTGTLHDIRRTIREIEERKKNASIDELMPDEDHQKMYSGRYYSVLIPEGYRYLENTDGFVFLLWKPNEQNPKEYESSEAVLYEEEDGRDETEDEDGVFDGNRFLARKTFPGKGKNHVFTVRLLNVPKEEEFSAKAAAEAFFQSIIF